MGNKKKNKILITPDDIRVLWMSANVDKINKRKDVERLYGNLDEEMRLLGWGIDVWDYNYMNHLEIGLTQSTNGKIVNNYEGEREKFTEDLAKCINEILNRY